MPHNVGVVPGGVTEKPTEDKITNFLWRLNEIRDFVDNIYISDVIAVAKTYSDYFEIGKGCRRLLTYGGFDLPTGRFFKSGVIGRDLQSESFAKERAISEVSHFSDAWRLSPSGCIFAESLCRSRGKHCLRNQPSRWFLVVKKILWFS